MIPESAQKDMRSPLRLGQIYYHDNEKWSMVCGVYKTKLAVFAIDKETPTLYYQNKDYPPISSKRADCEYSPVITRNSHLFRFGDTLYIRHGDTLKTAFMGFHCDNEQISIEHEGRFVKIGKNQAFKVLFI